jgi:hypothetical protein
LEPQRCDKCRYSGRPWLALLSVLAAMVAHGAAGNAPDRTVQRHTLVSTHDPAVRIRLPTSVTYVGADRWVLQRYTDDVELHCFVDADADGRVQHIYWLQFEAYLPSHPELQHHYTSKRHVTLGGMDFYLDTWTESSDAAEEPDSDGVHLKALLSSAGYRLPRSLMSVRLVHLMDDARRELMFIYSEDLAVTGLTASDVAKDGKAHGQWPAIEARLIERAKRRLIIQPAPR